MKLLIVDDSSLVRRCIMQQLDPTLSIEVQQATNGVEAVAKFKTQQPDVVTMDITMPEMDGLACVTELVALKPEARILVISALADEETAIDAVERGANGYICKPFTSEELAVALAELCEGL